MTNLIDKYSYEVTRRLPEKEREEVQRELQANIYDMLSENPTEDEVKSVLQSLGSPAVLAEQYRQKPRYLISPAFYDSYMRTLTWVVPLVACILFLLGGINGLVESLQNDVAMPLFIGRILGGAFGSAVSGAFQALVWVTVGFAIAERAGAKTKPQPWSVESLNDVVMDDKKKIPLADSIVELVLNLVFSTFFILFCLGKFPFVFTITDGTTMATLTQFFSESFLSVLIPCLVISLLFEIAASITKIVKRRYTPAVCVAEILKNLVTMALALFCLTRPGIFHADFLNFLEAQGWFSNGMLQLMGHPVPFHEAIVMFFGIIITIGCLCSIITTIYRTVKQSKC